MTIAPRVPSRKSFEDLIMFNVYAPLMHLNLIHVVKNFWMELKHHEITRIPKSSTLIAGGDIKARIGN
jgi:hypothetical protein